MAFSAHHVVQAIVDISDYNQLTNEKIVSVYNFRMNENADFYVKKILNSDIDLHIGLGSLVCSVGMCYKPA